MVEIVSFGGWLKQRRRALDLTQEALGRRAGCAAGTIKKFEQDERRPSREMAERLAEALEVAPEERAAFVKVARAERGVAELPMGTLTALPPSPPTPAHVEQARPELPTGTVTLLFSDLEGSTQLLQRLGARYDE